MKTNKLRQNSVKIYVNVMCNKLHILLLFLITFNPSCMAQRTKEPLGILKGTIGVFEGNCMPGPGIPPCEPKPLKTTVYITRPGESFDQTLLVDSTHSDDQGRYAVSLPAGSYSFFLKDEESIVCTVIQCPDACICLPFTIVSDSTTVIDANLDHATW